MKYKVRITKSPTDGLDEMAYGGQSNYGLDLGRRNIYDNINNSPYESVSDTLGPVERDEANIEAERGETVVGDFDQDGMMEHHKIGGKRHSQGGTPLKVPERSFVFSDTRKMKMGGDEVAMFGKSPNGKKYTPAQLAKQYDLNKYKAILEDPNTDQLNKRTAQMMLNNNMMKLGQLALVQEGKKGFPQGIPDIAMPYIQTAMPELLQSLQGYEEEQEEMMMAYGGMLPKYQGDKRGSQVPLTLEEARKAAQLAKGKSIPGGYQKIGVEGNRTYYGKGSKSMVPGQMIIKVLPVGPNAQGSFGAGRPIPTGGKSSMTVDEILRNPGKYRTFHQQVQGAPEDEKRRAAEILIRKGIMPGRWTPPSQSTMTRTMTIPGPGTEKIEKDYIYTEEEGIQPGNPGIISETPYEGYGARPFFGTSMFVGPYREKFYAAPFNASIPQPTFYDPNRELAANAEQANITQGYLSTMGTPQSFMANVSAVQGKAAENAANIMGRYQNMNVGVANQFSPLQTDIMNKVMAYRADAADKLFYNKQQGNKAYRNSMRQWLNNMDKYRKNEYNTNTMTTLLNQTNPYYDMTWGPRSGNIRFRPGVNVADLITGSSSGSSSPGFSNDEVQQYLAAANDYKSKGLDSSVYLPLLKARYPRFFTTARTPSTRTNPLVPYNSSYLGALGLRGMIGSGPLGAAGIDEDYDY